MANSELIFCLVYRTNQTLCSGSQWLVSALSFHHWCLASLPQDKCFFALMKEIQYGKLMEVISLEK